VILKSRTKYEEFLKLSHILQQQQYNNARVDKKESFNMLNSKIPAAVDM
jgi:hypothetical protein